ncbi:MAG: hypothetical protein OXK80_05960 [Bdellovibrionales bacterium]|nr:hypothetical protein [Bdellovibrionales bacterium]
MRSILVVIALYFGCAFGIYVDNNRITFVSVVAEAQGGNLLFEDEDFTISFNPDKFSSALINELNGIFTEVHSVEEYERDEEGSSSPIEIHFQVVTEGFEDHIHCELRVVNAETVVFFPCWGNVVTFASPVVLQLRDVGVLVRDASKSLSI